MTRSHALAQRANKIIAAGDAATEAGRDPRFGDVINIAGKELIVSGARPGGVHVLGAWGTVQLSRQEWASMCERDGLLVERGPC